jgi:hypothetical protein
MSKNRSTEVEKRRQLTVVALKTEFSRSEYAQFLGNELFEAVE